MAEWQVLAIVFAIGAASYAMRIGGFLAASTVPQGGRFRGLLALAPGNLLVAFTAAGILEGGWTALVGCLVAAGTMAVTKRDWAALGAGFAAVALLSAVF